jgi:hypothetical protein
MARMHHVRILRALTISGRHDHNEGTSHVGVHMNMQCDEEELDRERVPQRSVETTLGDGGVVLDAIGVPRSLYFIAERYPLNMQRTSAAPPIFTGRCRGVSARREASRRHTPPP